jgi:hypothetical protein
MHRASNLLLLVAFAGILLAPAVAGLTRFDPMGSLDENRQLAKRPAVSLLSRDTLHSPSAIAQQWEQYFGDHFGLRKFLVGSYRLVQFHLLRTSPNPAVVVGKSDGRSRWLFFDSDVAKQGIGFQSSLGKKPYSDADLAAIMSNLRRMTELARVNGVKLIIAVCPDKQTVYPEYLPSRLRPTPGTLSRLDQFWTAAAGLQDIPLVDLRIPLGKAKGKFYLYYPTDTHWNFRGAILGYEAIAKALQAQEPTREPMAVESVPWAKGDLIIGDLAKMLGLPTASGDPYSVAVLPGLDVTGSKRRGKLLALGDSFFNSMSPFFEQQFESVKKINAGRKAGTPWLSQALLDAEKPDVVLVESIERHWTEP